MYVNVPDIAQERPHTQPYRRNICELDRRLTKTLQQVFEIENTSVMCLDCEGGLGDSVHVSERLDSWNRAFLSPGIPLRAGIGSTPKTELSTMRLTSHPSD